jgi:hypothetical protein
LAQSVDFGMSTLWSLWGQSDMPTAGKCRE